MRPFVSRQTVWMWFLLVLGYLCGSLLTVYFSRGSYRLNWDLCVFALAVPSAQTLLLRLLRKWFRSDSKEADSPGAP